MGAVLHPEGLLAAALASAFLMPVVPPSQQPKNVSRHGQDVPWGAKVPPAENHWSKGEDHKKMTLLKGYMGANRGRR